MSQLQTQTWPRTLLVYDPGGTTGWARFTLIDQEHWRLDDWGEFELWSELHNQIRRGDIVVYEKISPRSLSFNPIGLEVTGVIKFLCERTLATIFYQTPGQMVGARRWGIYPLSGVKGEHAKDAIYHGLNWILQHGFPRLAESDILSERRNRETDGEDIDPAYFFDRLVQPASDPHRR